MTIYTKQMRRIRNINLNAVQWLIFIRQNDIGYGLLFYRFLPYIFFAAKQGRGQYARRISWLKTWQLYKELKNITWGKKVLAKKGKILLTIQDKHDIFIMPLLLYLQRQGVLTPCFPLPRFKLGGNMRRWARKFVMPKRFFPDRFRKRTTCDWERTI